MARHLNHPDYRRQQKHFKGKSRTRQSEAGETDVNKIVARHHKTGVITHLNNKPLQFGDLSQADDLKAALDLTLAAQDGFMELPATVRRAANNDPRVMLDMLSDPVGTELLVDAGLDIPFERVDTSEGLPFEPSSDGKSVAQTEGGSPQSSPAPAAGGGGEQAST